MNTFTTEHPLVQAEKAKRLGGVPGRLSLLRWVYVGRVSVATAIFVAAAFYFSAVPAGVIVTVAGAAVLSMVMTGFSAFYTHVRRKPPGDTFMYAQLVFDLVLITTVVHVTGGVASDFASLYILVIAVSAVTMPFRSTLLVTLMAAALYFADGFWGHQVQLTLSLWLQVAVFGAVALATGWLASRVRIVGVEREELEREVERIRLEAGDILREISGGIVTVAGDGSLVFANAAAESLLDFSAADYIGQSFLEFLSTRSQDLWAAIFATQREGRRLVRLEGMIHRDDRSFPIGLTTTLHRVESATPSVTAIFTDISDQKRISELHIRNQRLEAVAELSASLAHEIKNPLASIRSSVEQLGHSPHAVEDERNLADLIVRESDRLSRLLTEFLDFSRVRMTESVPLDICAVARRAIEVVRGHPACTEETLIEVSPGPVTVCGDEDLLHRVISNLVLNAVQAANGRVRIVIEALDVPVQELPSGVASELTVEVMITDDGPGIPSRIRDRLFDPFVSGRVGGSGLGLAIVQRAVEAHRGLIFVDSLPSGGTRFSIFLPARSAREEAA